MTVINLKTDIPGPKSLALVARREASTPRGAAKLTPLAFTHAQGAAITDIDGNTLLDFAGGIGMLAVGHNHPRVVAAIKAQADDLIHPCAIVGSYEPYVALAEKLTEIVPISGVKKAILLNSGAEAVETAVKIARAHTGRAGIVVFEGAYHGRTNLTLAMTSKYGLFKKGFGPFAPEVYRLPFPNVYRRPQGMSEDAFLDYAVGELEHAMTAQIDPSAIAAFVLEPVQGEGGFVPIPGRFYRRIRELCDAHGIVLVADEIQCGMGRTGKLFASEHYGIEPDLITTAKSLAAGMPISAVVGKAEIMDAPHPGGLGGTYSGNPLACAAALAAVDIISDPDFLARATELGEQLETHLKAFQREFPAIADVRGLGPMLALEFAQGGQPDPEMTAKVIGEALKRGLIVLRAGLYSNCLRFLPPLNLTDDELIEGMNVLHEALAAVFTKEAVAGD